MHTQLRNPNLHSSPGVAAEQKLAAIAYARVVGRLRFHVPSNQHEVINAGRAQAMGLIYACNVGGRHGYSSNLWDHTEKR
jgi:hypothetical protein